MSIPPPLPHIPTRQRKLTVKIIQKKSIDIEEARLKTRKRSNSYKVAKNRNYVVQTANFEELMQGTLNLTETFIQDFLQGKKLQEGQITQGKKIGSGSFGSVFRTEQVSEWKFIIKLPLDSIGKDAMHDEFIRSQNLIIQARDYANDSNKSNVFRNLLGLGSIIPVIGQTSDGGIIQELAEGINLLDLPKRIGEPGAEFLESQRGFPKDPQVAIQALCSFYYALLTLHSLDFVHCDVKTPNAILGKDNSIKLIDFGVLTKVGEEIVEHSATGAPETLYSPHPISDARPLYDIYSSAGIFLTCLFGKDGSDWDYSLFWPDSNGNPPQFIQMFSNPKIDRSEPIKEIFVDMNNEMGKFGANYPSVVLSKLADLFVGITSIDPVDRLYADEILEELEELALSDWANGHFRII